MQKLKYSPDEEQMLMTQLWSPHIKDDPEAFVMFCFPWGQQGTPLEHFKGPRAWQRKILRQLRDHVKQNNSIVDPEMFMLAVSSGRGIGKSALVCWLILWMITTRIGSTVIVSANSESQLRTVTWGELTKWAAMAINSHWWEIAATKLVPASWLTDLVERDLKKGTRYWAAEGKLWSEENPNAYAGAHNHDGMMVIFDEGSGIADSIWSIAAGFFTEKIADRYWMAFSNPRVPSGYFYEAIEGKKREFWQSEKIDARTVEGTDVQVYERIIKEYGEDSDEARIEVYGEFPSQGDDQFISPAVVESAQKRPRYKDTTAPIIIGVDPARGRDKTVIIIRQGRDIIDVRRYDDKETMQIVGRVIDAIEEFNPALTTLDEGGLGYGILDRLHEQRYKVRGVNFGWQSKNPRAWQNKRSEMWGSMREWLKTASIPQDRYLKTDLIAPRKKYNSSGAIILESKKEMKSRGVASPDSADALALTFAYPVASREERRQSSTRTYRSEHNRPSSSGWMGS